MTLLNPWAIALLIPIFFLFKELLLFKKIPDAGFSNSNIAYTKQNKMLAIVLIFLIIALSRPALENELSKQKFDANEYIVAIDASYSMSADDLKPSRYEAAKKSIISLLNIDAKNRYSIFAFTTSPLLICPPTTDTAIAINALNSLTPKYIMTKGTSLALLLKAISKLNQDKKNLIIFTDGGDEKDIKKLLTIAKKSAISINIVAVSSEKGTTLKHNNTQIKDENNHLVISRINPILKDLAHLSGGFYYELNSVKEGLSSKIYERLLEEQNSNKKIQTDVISYKELYYYPLLLAFITLIAALTKIQKYIPLLSLLLITTPNFTSYASVFDFYYLKEAKSAYSKKEYLKAADYFSKASPSQSSYLNIANSYYKAKNYQMAMRYYAQISSANPKLKQTIFYNMGNCAVKLKRYERAKNYYQKALALGDDKDANANLETLYKLRIKHKIDIADMLPKPNAKEKKSSSKKGEKQKGDENKNEKKDETEQSSSNSNRKASLKTQGAGANKKSKKQKDKTSKKAPSASQYKLGYKAYELINKGYTNEKNPW